MKIQFTRWLQCRISGGVRRISGVSPVRTNSHRYYNVNAIRPSNISNMIRPSLTKLLVPLALTVLIVALMWQMKMSEGLRSEIIRIQPSAARIVEADRLGGVVLPSSLSEWMRPATGPRKPLLVWIIRPDECLGCLAELDLWNSFTGPESPVSPVLVIGERDSIQVKGIARSAGLRTRVVPDPERLAERTLHLRLPSTKMLISENDTILIVDARFPAQACNWSLERTLREFSL